jgi:hypothetical protein
MCAKPVSTVNEPPPLAPPPHQQRPKGHVSVFGCACVRVCLLCVLMAVCACLRLFVAVCFSYVCVCQCLSCVCGCVCACARGRALVCLVLILARMKLGAVGCWGYWLQGLAVYRVRSEDRLVCCMCFPGERLPPCNISWLGFLKTIIDADTLSRDSVERVCRALRRVLTTSIIPTCPPRAVCVQCSRWCFCRLCSCWRAPDCGPGHWLWPGPS